MKFEPRRLTMAGAADIAKLVFGVLFEALKTNVLLNGVRGRPWHETILA